MTAWGLKISQCLLWAGSAWLLSEVLLLISPALIAVATALFKTLGYLLVGAIGLFLLFLLGRGARHE